MKDEIRICKNISENENGELMFAGVNTLELAEKYGTPLYVMDENRIREMCSSFRDAIAREFGEKGRILYASKACSFKRIYEIIASEKLHIDVVSTGEIHTAVRAGFPMQNAYFHSNNKTDNDIKFAIDNKVGHFVVDNVEELESLNRIAGEFGMKQKIILRVTPGIDPHTFEAVATGKVDSKFGSAIETGQAEEITAHALKMENLIFEGFHCHVGSELFEAGVFIDTAKIMLEFVADMYHKLGCFPELLDLGGGFGVRYIASQPTLDVDKTIGEIGGFIKNYCVQLGIEMPSIGFEPGRAIVADSGLTLYTVGTLKTIPGYKTYVSVDGGMTDNIRYALYGAEYTLAAAGKLNEDPDMVCSVVGKCCESGDIIQENIKLPSSTSRGDILACFTTGAYHYSMASNYNRIPRPAIVMIADKKDYPAVRRETLDDLTNLDI